MKARRPNFKVGQLVEIMRTQNSFSTQVVGEIGHVIQIGQLRDGGYGYVIRARPSEHYDVQEANLAAASRLGGKQRGRRLPARVTGAKKPAATRWAKARTKTKN